MTSLELSWKFMKRWLEHNAGPKYVDGLARKELFRIAAEHGLIGNVERSLEYHHARNETSHAYDQDVAREVFEAARKFFTDAQQLLHHLDSQNG